MAENPKNPERQRERTVSLHEGAVQRNVPWLLTESQAQELINMEIDDLGERRRRGGSRAFGGVFNVNPPGGLAGYNNADYDEFLLGVWGHHFYYSDADGAWLQTACAVSLISGLLHQVVEGRQGGDLAWAACTCEEVTETSLGINGRSQLVIHNIVQDAETQVSLAPRCIAPFQNRLFYAEGELVGWSELGDLGAFSDVNNILVEPGIGGEITALLPARDTDPRLWVFKEDAIFIFSPRWGTEGGFIADVVAGDALDTINSSVRTLSRNIGCVATKSIVWVPGAEQADVFFLARDGVRSLSRAEQDVQVGAGFPVSWNISDWIERINFAMAHKAVASVFDNAYHLAVPLDGARDNTHVLRYDIRNKAWTLHTIEARDLSNFRLAGEDRFWMQNRFPSADTSVTAGITDPSEAVYQVYSLYVGDLEPSTSITYPRRVEMSESSRSYSMQEPLIKKSWDYFTVELSSAETSALEVAYRSDQGGWNQLTEIYIAGTEGTIIFGQDALPWQSSPDITRRKSFHLGEIQPSYHLQIRLATPTGATETGKLKIYFSEITATLKTDKFTNDE